MIDTNPLFRPFAAALLGIAVAGCGDQVVIEGVDAKSGQEIQGAAAAVDDLGDGTTNEGGPEDVEADLHEAAIDDEKNLGPNAPGYIP